MRKAVMLDSHAYANKRNGESVMANLKYTHCMTLLRLDLLRGVSPEHTSIEAFRKV